MTTTKPSEVARHSASARAELASHPDHRVWHSESAGQPQADNRVAQLQRCIAKNRRIMQDANRVPAYLGSNPERRAEVTAANWRAHHAYLRMVSAQTALDRLLSGVSAAA